MEELASTSKKTKEDPDWLGTALSKVIEKKLEQRDKSIIVISGIRELEVVRYLKKYYDYYGFEVKAELPVRFRRALDDGKYFNADEFIRGEMRELDLGLQEVEDDAAFCIPTSPFTDPDRIVKATAKALRQKGVSLR